MATTRRDFIKAASVSALGLYFAPTALAQPRSPNERLNIACIGVGGQGGADLHEVAKFGDNIVALVDIDRERLQGQAANFPNARLYTDYRLMLHGQEDIDAVIVGTPDHHHAIPAAMAMVRGQHVYCEKPLTHTAYEARFLAELHKKTNVQTQMGNQGHASDALREAVEIMQSGILGKVTEAHVWTDRPVGWWPQGVTKPTVAEEQPLKYSWDNFLGPASWRPFHSAYQPFIWRGWYDFGTGAIGDIACHSCDSIFWGLDLGYPDLIEVYETDGTGTVDSPPERSRTRFVFPDGFVLHWHDGRWKPDESLFHGIAVPANGKLIIGTEGSLLLDGPKPWMLLPEAKWASYVKPAATLPRSPGNHEEWVRAARGGAPSLGHFSYSGHMTEVVVLGNIAHRAGGRIEWDGPNMRVKNVPSAQQYVSKHYRKGWDIHELTGIKPLFPWA